MKKIEAPAFSGESSAYAFTLSPELEAHEPPEERGVGRDGVRLMVSYGSRPGIIHTHFRNLPDFFERGDVLVVNTSQTINAAVRAARENNEPVELHFSNRLGAGEWIVEVRRPGPVASEPFFTARVGEELSLEGGARVILNSPFQISSRGAGEGQVRLWRASVQMLLPEYTYLERYGFPIRYKHIPREWPLASYQTVYATEPGSAEMPSAGRAFTRPILNRLEARGVAIAPLVLHCGIASLEDHEFPPAEYYRVPAETAAAVNGAHENRNRVVAVGTTVIRALDTVTSRDGTTHPGEGWTEVLITPQRGIFSVDGLLTGFHEPRSTHLLMIEALAGREHVRQTYAQAIRGRYLWHEFGDLHLILP
ncbi:MAG TPA: S-adenosylmethionine:tRNA ribosyltransferase-isomerase [Anaerolineaceae bacterium]|nr:S-adenosylmethionine:tRNA ribosyltransferase-isomerase [Anaerolineaceae bacterium]